MKTTCKKCKAELDIVGDFGGQVPFCENCQEFKCPDCGSSDFIYSDYDGMIEVKCKDCGFFWIKEEDLT